MESLIHIHPMYEILPGLYLSKFPEVIPTEITHVLNMCIQPHPIDNSRTYLHVPLLDIDDITREIPKITAFLDEALATNGIILVHCALGINRSAAAIVSYLCHKEEITAAQAVAKLKLKKADVRPSIVFLGQIARFYKRGGKTEDPLVAFHKRLEQRKLGGTPP